MSKSLAELRASTRTSLPERSYSLCLAQGLVAEVQALEEEAADLRTQALTADDDEGSKPPRRIGEGRNPRLAEIDARKEELFAEMREHTGELRLRGKTAGEWRRWVDAHPAREKNAVDEQAAYGMVNASDLADTLGDYAVAWNGADLGEGDWDFIANRAPAGDIKELCRLVVQMHEVPGARAPGKSQKTSLETPAT
ncbi:hypothetical protein NOK12_16490 [Nocardioides sp. OK12]|uniref:hypothetical protein n=1 Tax=Nocardioides sp. OK12 TaxID=2758661 RepID=UPI0021C305A1|nr:hypothetical protein [Nocardioides sp. OK12]GHJ59131.1 hypothetical protein NOK12_16490 [Nocardioides sp. OK12]